MLPCANHILEDWCAACFHSSHRQLLACVQVTLTKAYAVNANFSGRTQLKSPMALDTIVVAHGAGSLSLRIIAADNYQHD